MKRYAFLAQFLLLFGLTIATQTGCGDGNEGYAHAVIDWRIYYVDDVNAAYPISCAQAGAAWVVVKLNNYQTQEVFTNTFACDDRHWQGMTAGVPAGYYTANLELHTGSPAYPGASTLLDAFTLPTTDTYLLEVGTSALDPIYFYVNR